MKEITKIAPAEGKLGILIPGMGAVTTTFIAGVEAVRRGLASLGYVCRRPVWTVRHKAEEQADYLPKKKGAKRC